MTDRNRYIEVLSSASVGRAVESYRAKIELTVTTLKKKACLDESLALRDQIIAALKDAGLGEEDIEEGGGRVAQSSWSSSKTVVHELLVSHAEMSVLVQAMANVERVFAAIEQSWFSGVKKDFTFSVPSPEFANDLQAAEAALKKAVANAKSKATVMAKEAGLTLGGVLSIIEEPGQQERKRGDPRHISYFGGSSDSDFCLDFTEEQPASYTPVAPKQGTARICFRVRFAVNEGATDK